MKKFDDEKYGRVVIFEPEDISWFWTEFDGGELNIDSFRAGARSKLGDANIVGFRNRKKNIVKLFKNRYGPLEDFKIEMFVLNYKVKTDVERLTRACTLCYCKDIEVNLERGQIRCQSSKCGSVYCLNDREKEDIRIYLRIGFVESRFDILDIR